MSTQRLLSKPLLGGPFGEGRYALASMPCISHGLHSTRYMVVDPHGGAVLSISEDKLQALACARQLLKVANDSHLTPAAPPMQLELGFAEPEQPVAAPAAAAEPASPKVTRRRREIFDKSEGRCHYCDESLLLEGAWHIEHMMPRALGGTDAPLNLVAACTRCNLAKSDRTAIEFVAERT
jgi:hypothetical protein